MTLYHALEDGRDEQWVPWIWGRAKKHVKVISAKLQALGYDFTSNAGGTLQGNINLYMSTHADRRLDGCHRNRFVIDILYPGPIVDAMGERSHGLCYEAVINVSPDLVEEEDQTMQAILYGRRD